MPSSTDYFHQINSALCLVLGWPANFFVIWLTLYRGTDQSMRVWSRVLLQTAMVDLIVSLVFFLVHPVAMADGRMVYYVLDGPFALAPQPIALALYYLSSFWQEFAKYAVAVQFIYRWLLICREIELSNRLYVALLGIPSAMALLIVASIHWGLSMDGTGAGGELPSCPNATCPPDHTVIFTIRQDSIFLLLVTIAVMASNLATYVVIILSILLIWLKSSRAMLAEQPQRREVNRQIGFVLAIQAAIPMALYLVPTGLTLIWNTLGWPRPQWLSIVYVQCWPSVVYPLATIVIMKQFRQFLRNLLCAPSSAVGLLLNAPPTAPSAVGVTVVGGPTTGGKWPQQRGRQHLTMSSQFGGMGRHASK